MAAKTASLSVNIIADAAKARAGLKEAETAFGKFRREVGESQGAMGKFQTIGNSAFAAVKANAMNFAAAAGAAVVAFGVKSVMAFQDLALEAKKFSDSTGVSTESASRFIEVAGDIGIEAGTVEKAFGFMNKTLGNTPDLFKQLGVEIEYASNGTRDVAGTFLNVVERLNQIQDPAARAAAATKLLGRGWMEMSELIAMGSDDLAKSLAAVSDSKVFTPEETARAEEMRAAVDDLKDAWEDFSLTVGGKIIPLFTDLINAASSVGDVIKKIPFQDQIGAFLKDTAEFAVLGPFNTLKNGVELLGGALGFLNDDTEKNYVVTDKLKEAWIGGYRAMIDARNEASLLGSNIAGLQVDVEGATGAWQIFKGELSVKAESIRLTQDIEDFRVKWAGTTEEAKRKSREYQLELIAIQTQLANSALAIAGLATTAQNTRIRLLIETGQLERALSLIGAIQAGMNNLAGAVTPDRVERILGQGPPPPPPPPGGGSTKKTTTTTTQKKTVQPAATFGGPKVTTKRYAGLAAGGTLLSSGGVIVGEFGPELLNLPRGASVTPNIPQRMAGGGQTIINIQVQAGLVSSPDQVGAQIIDAIRRAERRSGQVFASV